MKALISPDEKVYSYTGALLGERVAEVTATPFPVSQPLFWIDCANDVVADRFYYDPANGNILPVPEGPSIGTKFVPNPALIGQEATLTWSVTGATAVMLSSYGTQQFPLSGSKVYTYQSAGTYVETLTAIAPDGNLAKPLTIKVVATQAELASSGNAPITVV